MYSNDLQELYGSYEIPTEIKKLFNLEDSLEKIKLPLDMIGFRTIREAYQYTITPLDVIPFADTGGDGIHFGFLTEFGQVKDLEEAPIVCVSPTNDPPIRLMARNINEFFNLATSVPYVEMLEAFSFYDKNQILQEIKEDEKELGKRGLAKRKKIREKLKQTFQTTEIDIDSYFKEVRDERNIKKAMDTLDGLGIIGNKEEKARSFSFQHPLNEEQINQMKQFLAEANKIEKLAFLRDANYSYVVAPDFDEPILPLFKELLTELHLLDEIKRLEMR